MADRDTGGQAFPSSTEQYYGEGMTLRDYFAGQALVGVMQRAEDISYTQTISMKSYEIADAMIAERNE